MDDVTMGEIKRLAASHAELTAQVVALTVILGAIVTTATIDYGQLERCVNYAVTKLRVARSPIALRRAAIVLKKLETMQLGLQIENRKIRNLRRLAAASR